MNRTFCSTLAAVLALSAAPAFAAGAPAIAAFDDAFAKVNDYTITVHSYEVKGSSRQDRTYQYWWKRPNLAKIAIVAGDGKGGGGTWRGGDTVSGHQGGMLAFIHLNVGLHDSRATSLRGYTLPEGLIQNEVDKYREMKGELSERPGPVIDGAATDEVQLKLADPASYGGVTRMVMYLNKATHYPVRQVRYEGDTVVADTTFSDLKTNVGLNDSDF